MEEKEIIIATDDCEKLIYLIAKAAEYNDTIKLQYANKYAPTAEYLIRLLRRGFGWLEIDRGKEDTTNTKCINKEEGECKAGELKGEIKCYESIRVNCKKYKPKYTNTFIVNTITIEKAGGIRGIK